MRGEDRGTAIGDVVGRWLICNGDSEPRDRGTGSVGTAKVVRTYRVDWRKVAKDEV